MAATTAAVTLPPLAVEDNPIAVDLPEEEPEEIKEPVTGTNCSQNTPSHPQELQTEPPAVPSHPPFINYIAELSDLSSSIASFQKCYDDLRNHLDSIKTAILSTLPSETLDVTPLAPSTVDVTPPPESAVQSTPLAESTSVDITRQPPSSVDITHAPSSSEKRQGEKLHLEGLCRTMCSRGIRRYITTHLSDLPKLREEVPKALKLSPNIPKMVLDCMGKFYLQSTRAFTKNSAMIPAREASIFVLECFLLLMGLDGTDNGVMAVEKSVKDEAETASVAWKKRLVAEGGLAKSNQVDARGLLLLIACFGIPNSFKREDVLDLVVAARAKEIVGVLKKSQLLMDKIREIVEDMMKNNMKVDAVDIAYTFGLEETFDPQIILISYLQEYKESSKKPEMASQVSAAALHNKANKKELDALKSVRKCLQRHKVNPEKLLPGWQIGEKILTLEKQISDLSKKSEDRPSQKRKASEPESSKRLKMKEPRRSRYTNQGPPQQHATSHGDPRRNTLPSHAINYSASPSVIYGGPGVRLLTESMISPRVGSSMSVGHGGNLYAGGDHGVGLSSRPQSYVYDADLVEKYAAAQPSIGLSSLYRASTSSSVGVPNSPSVVHGNWSSGSDIYQFADSVVERESYASGVPRGVGGDAPTAMPGHHRSSAYLYQV